MLSADRVFVVLATCAGIAFAISVPPLDPADERHHLARIFAISEGNISPAGPAVGHQHQIPRSLNRLHPPRWFRHKDGRRDRVRGNDGQIVCIHDVDDVMASFRIALNPQDRVPIRRPSTYGSIPYLPQALAVWVGRHLGGSAGLLLYIARFTTLACWVGLGWLALRITPVKPWTLMILSLSPMTVFQGSVVSADSISNGLALLLLAMTLRMAFAKGAPPGGGSIVALVAVTASLGLVKQGFWLLGLLLLVIPSARFPNRKVRIASIAFAAIAMSVLTVGWAAWLSAAQRIDGAAAMDLADRLPPFEYLGSWLATLSNYGYRLLAQFVGILGHLDVVLPRWIYAAYPLVAIGVALLEKDPPGLTVGRRLSLAAIGCAVAFTVLLLLFMISPDPKTATAGMIQGRYFLPVAPLLLVALPGWRGLPAVVGPVAITAFCTVVLAIATYTTAHHYFIGTTRSDARVSALRLDSPQRTIWGCVRGSCGGEMIRPEVPWTPPCADAAIARN
jgi:hypothetical protein